MRETFRKLTKLLKGVVTGKTACRQCNHVVHARNPITILRKIGIHCVRAGHTTEVSEEVKQRVESGYYDD